MGGLTVWTLDRAELSAPPTVFWKKKRTFSWPWMLESVVQMFVVLLCEHSFGQKYLHLELERLDDRDGRPNLWDWTKFIGGGGVCVSPMQGSKISKPEDEEGGQRQEGFFFFFLRGRGLAFVLSPPPLKRSPNRQICRGPASRRPIGCGGEADAGAAAGGSEDSSSSLSRRGTITQHQPFSHTTCRGWGPGGPRHAALAWVTPKRRRRTRLPSASSHHRWA